MGKHTTTHLFLLLVLGIAMLAAGPASAANATAGIAYRGSGGNYIGDVIIFDGFISNSSGALISVAGPGLPADGVPVYDLNGQPGSGTPVDVQPDGKWKLVWYSYLTKGLGKLETARYYFTITDRENAGNMAKTSVMLKKPDFYVAANPDPAMPGEYILLSGGAEHISGTARIDITDGSGRLFHTFMAPVSADGFFSYGFHIDMPPGAYILRLNSTATTATYQSGLIVTTPQETIVPQINPTVTITTAGTPIPTGTAPATTVSGKVPSTTASSPQQTSGLLVPILVIVVILIIGIGAAAIYMKRKQPAEAEEKEEE